jgi:integrase
MSLKLAARQRAAEPSREARPPSAKKNSMTVRAIVQFYRQDLFLRKRRVRLRGLVRLVEYQGDTFLEDITQQTADSWAKTLYRNASPATVETEFWVPLLSAWRCGARANGCGFPGIKKPCVRRIIRSVRFLYPDQFDTFVNAHNDHLIAPFRFAVGTGASNSEIWRVKWGDVDLENGEVSLANRVVAMPPDVVVMLASLIAMERGVPGDENLNVFCRPDGRKYVDRFGSGGQCKSALGTRCRDTGIFVRLRDLQDTYAVWHLAEHRDFAKLKKDSGWRSAKVNRYRTVSQEELDQVRDQLLRQASKHAMTPASRSVGGDRASAFRSRDFKHLASETQAPFRTLVRGPRPRTPTSGT